RQVERARSPPPRPAAGSADGQVDRPPGADHRGDEAIVGGDHPDRQVEAVAVGLGIEMEAELVAAADQRSEVEQHPARADVGVAAQASAPRLAADLPPDVDAADPQLADMDVELG